MGGLLLDDNVGDNLQYGHLISNSCRNGLQIKRAELLVMEGDRSFSESKEEISIQFVVERELRTKIHCSLVVVKCVRRRKERGKETVVWDANNKPNCKKARSSVARSPSFPCDAADFPFHSLETDLFTLSPPPSFSSLLVFIWLFHPIQLRLGLSGFLLHLLHYQMSLPNEMHSLDAFYYY